MQILNWIKEHVRPWIFHKDKVNTGTLIDQEENPNNGEQDDSYIDDDGMKNKDKFGIGIYFKWKF